MFGAERRQLILDLVRAHGAVSIRDLAQSVDVSEVTVRRDVSTLESRGLLERSHGGAMLPGREIGRDGPQRPRSCAPAAGVTAARLVRRAQGWGT